MDKAVFYISGQMAGIKDFNRPKFNEIENNIKLLYPKAVVLNPARHPDGLKYDTYMDYAMIDVENADILVMIDGWEKSKGACMEHIRAVQLDKNIIKEKYLK